MEKRSAFRPAGYLLGKFGLLVILAGLLLAAWNGQVVIVVLLGLALSAAGLSKLWSRFSLAGVSCQCLLNENRVFPGEHIELKLRLANRKLLPLPWIQLDYEIPFGFAADGSLAPGSRPGFGLISKSAALLWYTAASWKHYLYCNKRGYYMVGPVMLTSGDIFGFYPRSITESVIDHVIVYPRIFPMAQLGIPSLSPVGETTAERRIFEDPIRVIGVRDYTFHDSRRRIHWKASARHQSLQVKVFEPTTTLKVAIFLAVDSFKPQGGQAHSEDDFELGISAAASIASYLTERRSAVGLFVNSRLADSGMPCRIPPGSSAGQLVEILEALAKVTLQASGPFEEFFQNGRIGLPWGTTLVFILSRPQPSITDMLISLKEMGHKLLVVQAGGREESEAAQTITWHYIRKLGDLVKISSR